MQVKSTKAEGISENELVSRYRPFILALVLVLVCLAGHAISIWNSYVLNDHFDIPSMRNIFPDDWPQYLSNMVTQAMIDPFDEPMLKGSLALDYLSSRMAPALYHGTNLLLHISAVISAFILLRRLVKHFDRAQGTGAGAGSQGSEMVPFIACLLFAAHPLTSDVVAYVSARSAILTFLWYTLALHGFLTGFIATALFHYLSGYLFCCLSIIFALFSSCQAITVPESMIVLGMLIKPASEKFKDWIYQDMSQFALIVFLCLALPLLFLLPQTMPVGHGLGLPMLSAQAYYATQLKALVTYYMRVFIVPVPLSVAPPYCLADSFADPLAILGGLVLLGAIYLLVRLRKDPFSFLGLWLFLIGLIPQALVVTNEYVSGQRFYLSCFGLCLFTARLLTLYVAKKMPARETWAIAYEPRLVVPLALTTLVLIGLTNYRDRGFSTDSAVLRGALRANLGDTSLDKKAYLRGLLSLMLVYDGGDNVDRGLAEAKKALDINRNLPLAYLAMAKHALLRYDWDGGKYYAERTLKLAKEQNSPALVTGLADGCLLIAMTQLKKFDHPQELIDLSHKAIAADPSNSKLYLALGQTYLSLNKTESGLMALRELAHARKLDMNDINLTAPIAEAHLATGNPVDFESAYKAASLLHTINPTDASRTLVARTALETGRIIKGLTMLDQILTERKGQMDPEGWYLLSALYKQKGDQKLSDQFLAKARGMDPKIESKIHLWLKVKPLTPIQQAREESFEKGKPIQEKLKPRPQ